MRLLFNLLLGFFGLSSYGQELSNTTATKIVVDSINREVDRAVVQKNVPYMQKHFSTDFKFTHGTGMIDNKESWIGKAQSTRVQYMAREHDSINVELHNDIAIVTGVLRVILPSGGNRYGYAIRYERVYRLNKNVWQMISHRTFKEWELKK